MFALSRSLANVPGNERASHMPEWPVELLRARCELNELRAEDLLIFMENFWFFSG